MSYDYSRPVEITLTTLVYMTADEWQAVKELADNDGCSREEAFCEVMNRQIDDAINDPEHEQIDFLFEDGEVDS